LSWSLLILSFLLSILNLISNNIGLFSFIFLILIWTILLCLFYNLSLLNWWLSFFKLLFRKSLAPSSFFNCNLLTHIMVVGRVSFDYN
jgi:hypothetical protein